MCGISGFSWKNDEKIRAMVESLSYRGPDADGVFIDEGISLGHNRLSIIDLSASANQPMFDDKKELIIVFNGEIYNFRELKKELSDYDFKTKSDTEVILAGYQKWGKDVVKKLNGMFAFAIWDRRDGSLFCARDHAGMKPFYYFWNGEKFIFASEIPAILKHDIPRKLNLEAFNQYFRVLYVPEPLTMFENIYKLPAYHTLTLKNGEIHIDTYRQDRAETIDISYTDAVSALREKVIGAVERHLVADVPVGVYLSGGIDSSAVLSAMSGLRGNIKTFSVGFDLENIGEADKFNHDFELAKKTAEFFGTEHHSLIVSTKDALSAFEGAVAHNSDPISNPTSIAMLLLAKYARKEVTVALTGNAGDELFGGYDRYRMALAGHYYKKLPGFLRALGNMHGRISKLDYKNKTSLFAQFMFAKDNKLSRVISTNVFVDDSKIRESFESKYISKCTGDPAECFMTVDQRSWLPDYFFMLSDKMSMANALEERMPLADKELFGFSETIPRSYKLDLFRTKKVLKKAFRDDLPDFLFDQPKRGWFSPAAKWLRDPAFSKLGREVLSPDYFENTRDLFNWRELNEMLEKHINKEEYNLVIIWAAITFQAWARKYKVEV
ncbi:MAG: asparagine synthase (glutamine-hydrolyzing) [Patescibacteria group bacterium]